MAKKGPTKAERIASEVAFAVDAGEHCELETVDFGDRDRPKTCLEVDFPILPINQVAYIEGNAGKPIYQMSKWWARRRSSVFRAMLIAAAAKSPEEDSDAAGRVWKSFYKNHSNNAAFASLKVADVFMGGGTTVVEGSRLGMQLVGNDLNPVAWFVVEGQFLDVNRVDVVTALETIRHQVREEIISFYSCDCPRGHKGHWTHRSTGDSLSLGEFTSLSANSQEQYEYAGPEIIYTFWGKHGPCKATECDHLTPIMNTPVIAVKRLSVKAWRIECKECCCSYDVEQRDVRMAPNAMLVVQESEHPYVAIDRSGEVQCPNCNYKFTDPNAYTNKTTAILGASTTKKTEHTLLIHPDWLKGTGDFKLESVGGSTEDDPRSTARFHEDRDSNLNLVEVRGKLTEEIVLPSGKRMYTDSREGTIPRRSHFTCQAPTCGLDQDLLESVKELGQTAPFAPYAIQGFCPACKDEKQPYGGRFFDVANYRLFEEADKKWFELKNSKLDGYWPKDPIPIGAEIGPHDVNGHHYSNWFKLFNSRQLLTLSLLLREIDTFWENDSNLGAFLLGGFQQYLRNQNMFCFWDREYDKLVPFMSNNNFHPKSNVVENGVFTDLGRGNWNTAGETLLDGLDWRDNPWDLVSKQELENREVKVAKELKTKSAKVRPGDPLKRDNTNVKLLCGSSSSLDGWEDSAIDLVITDPPFGGILQYAELSDFFYVWLKLILDKRNFGSFQNGATPKSLEAVSNKFRHGDKSDEFYQRILTECWKECHRILKPSGILAFTFHHSEDEPWIAVLESLFNAGFYLEATYPIRSDETKGDGAFGSQKIEFDIIHVCRKRLDETTPISWARLRRQIARDVQQIEDLLARHQKAGLGEADIQVIRRGKALEYFSRHYGKVYIERGREDEFTVKDALVGINQLLNDESESSNEAPPFNAEPYTRQFLRLFFEKDELPRDQIQKFLRGTGVSPNDFEDRGWCNEEKKVFYMTPPLEWAKDWKGKPRKSMSRDFDQTYFLIGACYEDSGIKVSDTLNSGSFVPHPAIGDLLSWFVLHGSDQEMKDAADRARSIYRSWEAKHTKEVETQKSLFDLADED